MPPVNALQRPHLVNSNQLTEAIIRAAIKIHRKLGPGLLESAYETCLVFELKEIGLHVEQQKAVRLVYDGGKLEGVSGRHRSRWQNRCGSQIQGSAPSG